MGDMMGDSMHLKIIESMKASGVFDQFRKECIADVDTKPAYINLHTRVVKSVNDYLKNIPWSSKLLRISIRDGMRKQIVDSSYFEKGVDRIVNQAVDPKINTTFFPIVENAVYEFLGLQKPKPGESQEETEEDKKCWEQPMEIDPPQDSTDGVFQEAKPEVTEEKFIPDSSTLYVPPQSAFIEEQPVKVEVKYEEDTRVSAASESDLIIAEEQMMVEEAEEDDDEEESPPFEAIGLTSPPYPLPGSVLGPKTPPSPPPPPDTTEVKPPPATDFSHIFPKPPEPLEDTDIKHVLDDSAAAAASAGSSEKSEKNKTSSSTTSSSKERSSSSYKKPTSSSSDKDKHRSSSSSRSHHRSSSKSIHRDRDHSSSRDKYSDKDKSKHSDRDKDKSRKESSSSSKHTSSSKSLDSSKHSSTRHSTSGSSSRRHSSDSRAKDSRTHTDSSKSKNADEKSSSSSRHKDKDSKSSSHRDSSKSRSSSSNKDHDKHKSSSSSSRKTSSSKSESEQKSSSSKSKSREYEKDRNGDSQHKSSSSNKGSSSRKDNKVENNDVPMNETFKPPSPVQDSVSSFQDRGSPDVNEAGLRASQIFPTTSADDEETARDRWYSCSSSNLETADRLDSTRTSVSSFTQPKIESADPFGSSESSKNVPEAMDEVSPNSEGAFEREEEENSSSYPFSPSHMPKTPPEPYHSGDNSQTSLQIVVANDSYSLGLLSEEERAEKLRARTELAQSLLPPALSDDFKRRRNYLSRFTQSYVQDEDVPVSPINFNEIPSQISLTIDKSLLTPEILDVLTSNGANVSCGSYFQH